MNPWGSVRESQLKAVDHPRQILSVPSKAGLQARGGGSALFVKDKLGRRRPGVPCASTEAHCRPPLHGPGRECLSTSAPPPAYFMRSIFLLSASEPAWSR